MARITDNGLETAEGRTKELLQGVKGAFGMVPNLVKKIANSEAALEAYVGLNGAIGGGNFDAETREAIALAVAGGNGCDYCASAHTAASKGLKVEPAEIDRRLNGRATDPQLDAILQFAIRVLDTRGHVSNEDLQAVRDAGLEDEDIVELIGNVVLNIFTNYVNHVADTDIDFPKVSVNSVRQAA